MSKRWAALAAPTALGAAAQNRPAPPATPRIYIFDNCTIRGLDQRSSSS